MPAQEAFLFYTQQLQLYEAYSQAGVPLAGATSWVAIPNGTGLHQWTIFLGNIHMQFHVCSMRSR